MPKLYKSITSPRRAGSTKKDTIEINHNPSSSWTLSTIISTTTTPKMKTNRNTDNNNNTKNENKQKYWQQQQQQQQQQSITIKLFHCIWLLFNCIWFTLSGLIFAWIYFCDFRKFCPLSLRKKFGNCQFSKINPRKFFWK